MDKKICVDGRSNRTCVVAMKANVQITVATKDQRSYLQNGFTTPPFKVANITESKQTQALRLMIMSASPGVLNNDEYDIDIQVMENASLLLETQSYQRIFATHNSAAQRTRVIVKKEAELIYLPHPSVPHAGAAFTSSNHIYLEKSARLTWGEIITCGRQLKGEVFQFSKYHSTTNIYIDNKLMVRENLLLQPALQPIAGMGLLEGYTHQASLIHIDPLADFSETADEVQDYLDREQAIVFGITKLPCNGVLVRVLGYKAEQLFDCLKAISHIFSGKRCLLAV